MPTINLDLSVDGISKAIKELEEYKKSLDAKVDEAVESVANYGREKAQERFDNAEYDGNRDVAVTTERAGDMWEIVARGDAVAFIEFGTGITYGYGYRGNKPDGIVDIGEHGKKHGRFPFWSYPAENDDGRNQNFDTLNHDYLYTMGNPPAEAMYRTILDIQENIPNIIKEKFND